MIEALQRIAQCLFDPILSTKRCIADLTIHATRSSHDLIVSGGFSPLYSFFDDIVDTNTTLVTEWIHLYNNLGINREMTATQSLETIVILQIFNQTIWCIVLV